MTTGVWDDTVKPGEKVGRDRWGRPMIVPEGGGKAVAYTRCTTFVDCLEDQYNLTRWKTRMTAIGIMLRPDLQLAVTAAGDDKSRLNDITDQAMDAAASHAAANVGTAIHALTERVDRGESLDGVPAAYLPDLEAYRSLMAGLEVVDTESFGVHDGLKIGGTWDRIVRLNGRLMIADIKTGSVDYGMGKIAMQLAVYSRCRRYNPDTAERTNLDVDQDTGIVIHVPAGTGTGRLLRVNLAAGWEAVALARQVRAWRARKDLSKVMDVALENQPALPLPPAEPVSSKPPEWSVTAYNAAMMNAIQAAATEAELRQLWADNKPGWAPEHTEAARARAAELKEGTENGR